MYLSFYRYFHYVITFGGIVYLFIHYNNYLLGETLVSSFFSMIMMIQQNRTNELQRMTIIICGATMQLITFSITMIMLYNDINNIYTIVFVLYTICFIIVFSIILCIIMCLGLLISETYSFSTSTNTNSNMVLNQHKTVFIPVKNTGESKNYTFV
jgi:membrane glycosyltransferase